MPAPTDDVREEAVTVHTRRGDALHVVLDATPPTRPVAVVVHGFRDSRDGPCPLGVTRALRAQGALRVARYDAGARAGFGGFAGHRAQAEDLRAVVGALRARGCDVRLAVGHSKGGVVVLLYAALVAAEGEAADVVAVAARFDMVSAARRRFSEEDRAALERDGKVEHAVCGGAIVITRECVAEYEGLDMRRECASVKGRVLFVHGMGDRQVPWEDAVALRDATPRGKLCLIEGARHRMLGAYERIASEIAAFVEAGDLERDAERGGERDRERDGER